LYHKIRGLSTVGKKLIFDKYRGLRDSPLSQKGDRRREATGGFSLCGKYVIMTVGKKPQSGFCSRILRELLK
jgi:hypothetical protein